MANKLAVVATTVGLLGGLAGGVTLLAPNLAGADTSSSTTSPAPQDGAANRADHLRSTLQSLVDDGTLTQAQLDAVITKLTASMPDRGRPGGPGGRGGPGGPGGRMGAGFDALGIGADAAAKAIGISTADLTAAVRGGKSVADVAKEKGVDPAAVVAAVVAAEGAALDQAVTAGKLTQAQADQIKSKLADRVTELVNKAGLGSGGHGGGGPRRQGSGFPGGPRSGGQITTS